MSQTKERLFIMSRSTPYMVKNDKGRYVTRKGIGAVHSWKTGSQVLVFQDMAAFEKAKDCLERGGTIA